MVAISRASRKKVYGGSHHSSKINKNGVKGSRKYQLSFRGIMFTLIIGWICLFMYGGDEGGGSSPSPSQSDNNIRKHRLENKIHAVRNKVHEIEEKVQKKVVSVEQKIQHKVENFIVKQENYWKGNHDEGADFDHPPLAVVIVGTEEEELMKSIKSLLEHTNRDQILTICVAFMTDDVMTSEDKKRMERQAADLDNGQTLHWHDTNFHTHDKNEIDDHRHTSKIHLLFHDKSPSVGKSRQECVTFVDFLVEEHKDAQRMNPDQEVLLLFLRPDARLIQDDWVDPVVQALILPPNNYHNVPKTLNKELNITEKQQQLVSAVSLSVEGQDGEQLSLTETLESNTIFRKLDEVPSLSYPTPLLLGPASIMTLNTYWKNLPLVGESTAMDTFFASDVELSFNLWLCANGINVLANVPVRLDSSSNSKNNNSNNPQPSYTTTTTASAAYLLHNWIQTTTKKQQQQTEYKNRLLSIIAARLNISPSQLQTNINNDDSVKPDKLTRIANECKSFSWFMDTINSPKQKNIKNVMNDTETKEPKKPIQPLRPLNLNLVKDLKQYTLEYVDVAKDHKEHPHMGATDENGNFGYVHDETALRLNPPKINLPDDVENQRMCTNHEANYKMLTEKVFIDTTAHEAAERRAQTGNTPRVKIFCSVYTIAKYHHKLAPILETWGPKCDGFMAASDKTVPELHTVNIVHEGPESYENMYQKIRSMWAYIYDNYYDKYDFFHIGGDDLYILVENLRLYLESEEIQTATNGGIYLPEQPQKTANPIFLGRRFKEGGNENRIFNSGGAGYTLNKAALKALVVDAFPTCFPHHKTFAEDVMIATCLRNKIHVLPYDTKDDKGGERYMPFTPGHHYTYHYSPRDKDDWYTKYSIDIKYGADHCAARSVAFHYIDSALMRKMHAILYGYCNGAA